MSVSARLRGAIALYVALLAAMLIYHVRTVERAAERGRVLTAIASRLRVVSSVQPARLAELSAAAEKYLVTRDRDYLDRFNTLARAHGDELRRLASQPMSDSERASLMSLLRHWRAVEAGGLQELDDIIAWTQQLADASQSALNRELADSERATRAAGRIAWLGAGSALLFGVLLSILLVRSIVRPLERLAQGTREVSASRFGYRLDTRGTDEFAQVSADFNAMTERLGELDRMKRDFISNVSHDLKTPLSSMQETIDVMLDELPGPLSDTQRRLLSLNQESARRLSSMVAKLLDLSRFESAPAPHRPLIDVGLLARGAVDRAAGWPGRRAAVTLFESDGGGRCRRLVADDDAIARLLDNLIENAVKFSPAGGAVRVTVGDTHSPGGVLITVADEGPGIPDAEKERVFDRFYQTEAGRAVASRGAGLGLSICRHIVEAHDGAIWITDHEPRGSVFCVFLPGSSSSVGEDSPDSHIPAGSTA